MKRDLSLYAQNRAVLGDGVGSTRLPVPGYDEVRDRFYCTWCNDLLPSKRNTSHYMRKHRLRFGLQGEGATWVFEKD